jgi:N-acetylglucosaminyldiphosphoundecaprenol N-acetyl-beta-D-mannosaminyltransferase
MRKIYITSLHLLHGGVEMAITALSNALVSRGYDVEILCTYNLGQPAYSLDERVTVTYLTDVHPNRDEFKQAIRSKNLGRIFHEGFYAIRVLQLKKKVLKQCFRRIREGIIISTRNEDSVLLSRYGNKGVLKIAQLHHDHCFDKKLLRDFTCHYGNIDVFTLLTPQLQQEVAEIMRNNHHTKCVVMPNVLPAAQECGADAPLENQAVAVGRLHPVKAFVRLIRLWKGIYEKTGTVLKIIGGGEQQAELEKEIAEQGLENGVILTGAMDHGQVLNEMKKSVFFAMTSVSEGLPYVIIEAMSQGLPAIAYDVRVGPRAIIDHEENGFLIPEDDQETFAEKALQLINDPQLRQNMSQSAKEKATNFTEERILEMWNELFEIEGE